MQTVLSSHLKNIITLNRYKYLTEISRFAKKCNTRTVRITYISFICCLGKNISSNQHTTDIFSIP